MKLRHLAGKFASWFQFLLGFALLLSNLALSDPTPDATTIDSGTSVSSWGYPLATVLDAGPSLPGREKRSLMHFYQMVRCGMGCDPMAYMGYGCYCGFSGQGFPVDGIDKCCQEHDHCYSASSCNPFQHYYAPYRWNCDRGSPVCMGTHGGHQRHRCGDQLCKCDWKFVKCISRMSCPTSKAVCRSTPLRLMNARISKKINSIARSLLG